MTGIRQMPMFRPRGSLTTTIPSPADSESWHRAYMAVQVLKSVPGRGCALFRELQAAIERWRRGAPEHNGNFSYTDNHAGAFIGTRTQGG
jgi:hypothetical protein